ncbi:hypothetical protein KSC_110320 [Ktedonobacter sp. SOSP1-52]|uniref:extracellular solute-binding protein n=1 Tax=Ktedonobacter sp. SOSP1-52 TaxID=2778366 RepID=UPI0019150F33|nr:extracellular solute-binding protein [Ktedonobacter sp. SOSP1-52]GHO72140.1 hypothetical protein KSC_110320 [Ktedonobacter sp. SOSP1-52]
MKPNLHLKKERELRGWSQAKVASEIGVEPHSVSRWERGVSHPYPFYREKLCTLFGTDAETLGFLSNIDSEEPGDFALVDPSAQVVSPDRSYLFDPAIPLPLALPGELVGRSALFHQLKQRLLEGKNTGEITLLQGLPGVGKTTLACALAHDPEIRECFHAGILWASVGSTPDVYKHLARWGTLLGCSLEQNYQREDWAETIHVQMGQKSLLFILDDIWDIETILELKVGGNHCVYLITSRLPQVSRHFARENVWMVPELNEQDSIALLEHFVPTLTTHHVDIAQKLAYVTGGLPFSLALIGKYLRAQCTNDQPHRLHTALRQVQNRIFRFRLSEPASLVDRHSSLPAGTPLSLSAIIAPSEYRIDKYEREAWQALTVFPAKPNTFSEEAALAVCQLPLAILDGLSDAGLLESPEPHRYQLPQTLHDYAQAQLIDMYDATLRFVFYIVHYVEEHATDYAALDREYYNILTAIEHAQLHALKTEYIRGVIAFSSFLLLRGMYELARELLLQAYHWAQAQQDIPHIQLLLIYLFQVAREQNQIHQAEVYLRDGLLYARQQADETMINYFLTSLTEVLEQQKEYDRLHDYVTEGQGSKLQLLFKTWPLTRYQVRSKAMIERNFVHFTEAQKLLQHGVLADINEFFQTWKYANSVHPTYLKIVMGPDQHIYGLPAEAYTMCLVYNRRLFQEAGLDPDQPPTTWEELRAMAQQLTHRRRGCYGFVETTTNNMGGWHFTNWLYTAGVEPQYYQNGAWKTAFNDARAVSFLEMLKKMRFQDSSIPSQALLSSREIEYLFSRGQVAMIVAAPNIIRTLSKDGVMNINDIGLAAMPQHGGNACLTGGTVRVFHGQSSFHAIRAAFEQILAEHFDIDNYEARLKALAPHEVIGIPTSSLFAGKLQQQLEEITAKYANVPVENYRSYITSKITPRTEPPIEAQKYYALIDPVLQSILTNPWADPQKLLDAATQQFQEQVLEKLDFPHHD